MEVYMTVEDEPPLWDFIQQTLGRIIHIFSPVWPPAPLTAPPRDSTKNSECLAIWYADVIGEEELLHPDCHPVRRADGLYDAWELPLVTFQRLWHWKKQGTILAVELDYRAFRPNRPEGAEFTPDEVADFERRLALLRQKVGVIHEWCASHLRKGYIGEHAWRESEELRRYG